MPNKRPRIVFILPTLSAGGAERVLITLMNGLDTNQYERVFLAVSEEGGLRSLIAPDIPFHSLGKGTRFGSSLPKIYRKLKELQPDIVVSTMAHMNFAVLLLKPFFPNTRFVVREAITPSYFSQKSFVIRSIVKLSYRRLYPRADMVISPAQKIIDEFRDLLKISVKNHALLPNPVDVERILASVAREAAITESRREAIHYVCAGRLVSQKGFDQLIAHLPALKNCYDWHLTILGEGEQREDLQKVIETMGLKSKVTLAGFTDVPWSVIASADAFLMPSRYEGLPNVVLEALACGTPVIATRTSGGIDEIAVHAQAHAGSLTVVDGMDEFIGAMAAVTPMPVEGLRPSLLPRCYEKTAVFERFTKLLAEVSAL